MSLFKKIAVGVSTVALPASMFFGSAAVTKAATAGGVYSTPDGTVWFVTKDMQKRPFTSAGAFLSYGFLNFSQVTPADASVTALPTGSFIAPADGKIFCATETKGTDVAGECALITGSKKASFTSAAVFAAQGHSFARAMYGDSSFLEKTSNISDGSAAHLPGVLVNNGGTVQMVVSGGLWGIPSQDVFNSWGYNFADVVPANSADLVKEQIGVIPARQAGELVPTGLTGGPTPGPKDCNLDGSAGSIDVESSSIYSNEEVGEGQEEVPVMAFRVEADNDSDIEIRSIRVALEHTGSGSQDLDDYATEITVWQGDDMVGSADVDEFTENNDIFTKTINLDCAVIDADETEEFSVAVSALRNIDSNDLDEVWNIDVTSIRFMDGDGVTTTESQSGLDQDFTFVDFVTAADVELRVALNDDEEDINDAHNILVDEDTTTKNEPVLAFTLEARGDSDITVDEIPVLLTTDDDDMDSVATTAHLYQGTTKLSTETITSSNTDHDNDAQTALVIFDDLDFDIDAGDKEEFQVRLDFARRTVSTYAEGTTVRAEITSALADSDLEAEDEEGNDLSSSEISGSALGEDHSLFTQGIQVEVTSKQTNVNTNDGADNDSVEFVWEVTITNIGDEDVFINADNADVVSSDTAADVDTLYASEDGAATLGSFSGTITDENATESTASAGNFNGEVFYKIAAGGSEDFTITVTATNSAGAGQVRGWLTAIEWTTNINGGVAESYTANLVQDSRTPFKLVN